MVSEAGYSNTPWYGNDIVLLNCHAMSSGLFLTATVDFLNGFRYVSRSVEECAFQAMLLNYNVNRRGMIVTFRLSPYEADIS